LHGLVSGLGAATADAAYGTIAALGLTALSSLLIDNAFWLQLFGGGFLLYLGIRTLMSTPAEKAAEANAEAPGYLGAYASIFALTITNPMTILAFVGIFAGLGAEAIGETSGAALVMVIGVFLGSAAWWLLLSAGVSLLRSRINTQALRWINRLSGTIIIAFALRILWNIVAGTGM